MTTTGPAPSSRRPSHEASLAGVRLAWNNSTIFGGIIVAIAVGGFVLTEEYTGKPGSVLFAGGVTAGLTYLIALVWRALVVGWVMRLTSGDRRSIPIDGFGATSVPQDTPARASLAAGIAAPVSLMVFAAGLFGGAFIATNAAMDPVLRSVLRGGGVLALTLGIVTLLPAFPLDGGRALAGFLELRGWDRTRAGLVPARIGPYLGGVLVAGGVLAGIELTAFGWWIAVLGALISIASTGMRRQLNVTSDLSKLTVAQVMEPNRLAGPSWLTVNAFFDRVARGKHEDFFPLLSFDGSVDGVVLRSQLLAVPPDQREQVSVRAIAVPKTAVPTVQAQDSAAVIVQKLGNSFPMVPCILVVDDDNHLVGTITGRDIERRLRSMPSAFLGTR